MGKSLVIKGADFSANGIPEVTDITSIVAASASYRACESISSFISTGSTSNNKRCCVVATSFESLGIDISEYTKIEITFKNGFDYVFGTGPRTSSSANWQGWNGSTGGQSFGWVTDNQKATATVDATTLRFSLNLRHDDNTTTFSENTLLTDIVDSIILK